MRHRKQSTTEIYVEGNYTDTQDVMTLLEIDKVENIETDSRKISRKNARRG
jgi:hypothetical protein